MSPLNAGVFDSKSPVRRVADAHFHVLDDIRVVLAMKPRMAAAVLRNANAAI